MPVRPYNYYDQTISLCPECLKRIDAKIVFRNGNVYMFKHCLEHGQSEVLIATDIDYYKNIRNYNKPSDMPYRFNTQVQKGCPHDCGLCSDHEQHSCVTVIEVTDLCNLSCPTCYAMSSPNHGNHRSIKEIEAMLDIIVQNEKEPAVVQISGGEPTIHPDFFQIMDIAKSKPIKHLMLNTNGIRIAEDKAFVERLASYMPDFEIYLQFDSLRPEVLKRMRGKDLSQIRQKAIEHLNEFNLSTTLVVTLQKGLNDDEMGKIIEYALQQKCIRGVTFQPIQYAGRIEQSNPMEGRLTLTEVRQDILDQTNVFQSNDLIPVPCHPDALAMAYALKVDGQVFPMTRYVDPAILLLDRSQNTIIYEQDESLHQHMIQLFSTGISVDNAEKNLKNLLCCLPQADVEGLSYDNLFRVLIMKFMDAYDFDVRSVRKSCVHIVHQDGRLIPFDTMNLFYRK